MSWACMNWATRRSKSVTTQASTSIQSTCLSLSTIEAFSPGYLMAKSFISPICADQIPYAASVMANAFATAPRFQFLVPSDAQRVAKLRWYWGATIRACVRSRGVVQVVCGESGSTVRAVAIWEPPEQCDYSALTRLRSGLWAAPLRLGISANRRRRALGSVLSALDVPPPMLVLERHRRRAFGATHRSRNGAA